MKHKGPIWIVIFFLIVLFILLNTLDIKAYFSSIEIKATTPQGYPADITISNLEPPEEIDGKLYQYFHIDLKEKDNTVSIQLANQWLEEKTIAPNHLQLYYQATKESAWEEKRIVNIQPGEKITTYTFSNLQSGNYHLRGTTKTIEKKSTNISLQTELLILIGIITILLFIAYHHHASKDVHRHEKKKPDQEQLDKYIKESLLSGHDEKAIIERLQKAGWNKKQIDEGIRRTRLL